MSHQRSTSQQSLPIREDGTRLATIKRAPDEEIRIELSEYKGHEFVSVRRWFLSNGNWYPDKTRGISIRISEIEAYLKGLNAALEQTGGTSKGRGHDDGSRLAAPWAGHFRKPGPSTASPRLPLTAPATAPWMESLPPVGSMTSEPGFDEFANDQHSKGD